ncbi:MAG: DUF4365 domain-containing protein [Candidatus Paceibacterota bacterium]|jgi:hypothetical protein
MKDNFFNNLSLPSSNAMEDLETISRNKLSLLLSPSLFELRVEMQRDKGIDLTVEIKKDNKYTNFRFAVQLKSTATIKANKDGSISFPVETSNINYLLNYGMPAYYILYNHVMDTFYAEPAEQVYLNVVKKYPTQKYPEKFKVRFSKLLTAELITEIYNTTLEKGMVLRRLTSHLKFSVSNGKSEGIVIDQDNEVYSVTQNIDFINQFGPMLINNAQFKQIIEIEQRTHPRTEASPIFNLVCGIAYFQHGNLYKAMELLKLAQQKSDSFDINIQAMLTYTLLNAKFLLGILNKVEFEEQIAKIAENENSGTFFEIEKAYNELSSNNVKPVKGIKTLYTAIANIIKKDEKNIHLRITAYAKILDAEAIILFHDLELNFSYFLGKAKEPLKSKAYIEFLELEKVYLKRIDMLTEFALKNKYFLGVSNLASSKIIWSYKKIFHSHILNNWKKNAYKLSKPLSAEDFDTLLKSCDKLDKIAETYEMLEHRENMISCLNNKYEILHFIEQNEAAEQTKTKILEMIENNDFVGLRTRHNEMIYGKTPHEKFIKNYASRINGIQDLAKKCGLDIFRYSSEDILNRKPEWSIDNFLEFQFPD